MTYQYIKTLYPTDEEVSHELIRHKGKLGQTAKALGCQSYYVRWRIRENPDIMNAYLHARDEIVDMAEQVMIDKMKDGSESAARYILSTLGKERGYTERLELTGKDGADITVTLNLGRKEIVIKPDEDYEEQEILDGEINGAYTTLSADD